MTSAPPRDSQPGRRLKVVLFSGGRGSRALSRELVKNPRIALTLAVNGYDDGASTGEVRRFLGCLGPSDFRKNGSWLARELHTCPPELVDVLDARLPQPFTAEEGAAVLDALASAAAVPLPAAVAPLATAAGGLPVAVREALAERVAAFRAELPGRAFSFSDCSLGNLVFAGSFLIRGRRFNEAVADYSRLLGLPEEMIENVTDGADAYLVALDQDGRLLGSEADIVDASRRSHIRDLFLLGAPLTATEKVELAELPTAEVEAFLARRAVRPVPNPRLLDKLREADLVVYAPGTQHSSLFPSYLTPGLGEVLASNLRAVKLLVTNLHEDAEIADASAVDIIDRAVYYLREQGRRHIPTPFLISHYLLNDPTRVEAEAAYVPLGRLDAIEDPRLLRVGNYEDGATGRHNAAKILGPFIDALAGPVRVPRVALCLLETASLDKVSQTLVEVLRGGLFELPLSVVALHAGPESLDPAFAARLPFPVRNVSVPREGVSGWTAALAAESFDYVLLFESSGMYKGEDAVGLASYLAPGRLDAVWGSRRLSVKDIQHSYRFRYGGHPMLGALSYAGSHLLSAAYLCLYGRYISDTLSGVRAVRARYLQGVPDLADPGLNQVLLSKVLRDRGEILETPVQFLPMSADKVRRTTVLDGLRSLATAVRGRFAPPPAPAGDAATVPLAAGGETALR